MGHGNEFKIPDYRIYKVEDIPVLQNVQNKLAEHGLRDPWLRNEVWRYQLPNAQDSHYRRAFRHMGRGLPLALGLMVLTVIGEKTYQKLFPAHDDQHGSGHH